MVSVLPLTSSTIRADILYKLQSKALELKQFLETQISIPPSPSYSGPIPVLNLPFPDDLLLVVDDMGLPKHLSSQLKAKITETIHQSQRACTDFFRQTCHGLTGDAASSHYIMKLVDVYQAFYNNHQIYTIRSRLLASKATFEMLSKHKNQHAKKPMFNSEYTPLLEKYFEQNAYPSRPDRILLARKSSMSERQIEVWFQNHRNRSKKEGVPLKRISPHQVSADIFEQKTPSNVKLSKRTSASSRVNIEIPAKNNCIVQTAGQSSKLLSTSPSLRTFPTPYVNSSVNLWSLQARTVIFPSPNWPRRPATQSPSQSSIDMDEFIVMFSSKLNIRRGLGMKSMHRTPGMKSWFDAMVTIPSCAPHPALIRARDPFPSSVSIPSLPTIAVNLSTLSSVRNKSLPWAPYPSKHVARFRKMAPFAFRTPQKLSSLLSINASSPASEFFGSRTPSFTSVSSSDSRSTSLSYGSSPEPTTPPYSPTAESCFIHEPEVQESNTDDYLNLFAEIAEPQYEDLPQDLDYFLANFSNEDIFGKDLNLDPSYAHA